MWCQRSLTSLTSLQLPSRESTFSWAVPQGEVFHQDKWWQFMFSTLWEKDLASDICIPRKLLANLTHIQACLEWCFNFSPLILNLFFSFLNKGVYFVNHFFYLSKNAQLQKKLPFEIHLLIGTNKFYVARQRSARGTAVGAVGPSAGTPPPAAQHSQPGPLLPWLKGNLQCKGDSLKSYTQEFLKKMAIN